MVLPHFSFLLMDQFKIYLRMNSTVRIELVLKLDKDDPRSVLIHNKTLNILSMSILICMAPKSVKSLKGAISTQGHLFLNRKVLIQFLHGCGWKLAVSFGMLFQIVYVCSNRMLLGTGQQQQTFGMNRNVVVRTGDDDE